MDALQIKVLIINLITKLLKWIYFIQNIVIDSNKLCQNCDSSCSVGKCIEA